MAMEDIEARSRLASVLDVCEYEIQALDALHDARLGLSGVTQAMNDASRGGRCGARDAHARDPKPHALGAPCFPVSLFDPLEPCSFACERLFAVPSATTLVLVVLPWAGRAGGNAAGGTGLKL